MLLVSSQGMKCLWKEKCSKLCDIENGHHYVLHMRFQFESFLVSLSQIRNLLQQTLGTLRTNTLEHSELELVKRTQWVLGEG